MSRFVSGVFNDLNEECRSDILHDNMNISHLMVHTHQVEEGRVKKKSRDLIGQGPVMVVLRSVELISKTNQGSKRGSQFNFLQNSPWLVMIGCLTLSLKRDDVLPHLTRTQLVKSGARSIMAIALLGWTIALGVSREATRLGISLM